MTKETSTAVGKPPTAWRRFGLQAVFLYAVWLLLSGHYDLFHLLLGVLSVGLVLWINRAILPSAAWRPDDPALRLDRCLFYFPWLMWEMVLSGVHVAWVVLHPRLLIAPRLVRFKSDLPGDLARVILGNSITLTPGTLTLEIEDREFLVHALTPDTAAGLLDGGMQTKVARLFVDEPGRMVYDVSTQTARGND